MDFLSFFNGMGGQKPNPYGNNQSTAWGPGWGQEAAQNAMPQLQQVQQSAEFGTMGMPPSLQAQLQNEAQAQGGLAQEQANFDPYIGADPIGMVLPPRGSIQPQGQMPMRPQAQSFNAGSGQSMPPAMPYSNLAGGIGQGMSASARPTEQQLAAGPPSARQTGLGDIFNFTSSYDMNPSNTQGFDPNMFLRMSQGYNQGGLLGALGMLLTDTYNSAAPK